MLKIFIIIYIFKCVFADDESYEKYIDMLPEQEKREVLDRIARRILEDITTDNVPNQSQVEITDEQLQVHDAYVKDILKEEADRLKYEKKIDDTKRTEELGNERDDENRHIDLTLRSGKRSKRKNVDQDKKLETTSEVAYNVIPVKTVHDSEYEPVEATIAESNEISSTSSTKQNENFTSDVTKNDSDSSLLSVQEKLIPQSSNNNLRKAFQSVNQVSTVSIDLDEKFDNNSSVKEDYNMNSETIVPLSEEPTDNITIEDRKIDKLNANEKYEEAVKTDAKPVVLNNISTTVSIQATFPNEKNNTNEFETVTVQQKEQGTLRFLNQPFQRKGGLDINENISNTVDTTITDINDRNDSSIKLTPSPIDNIQINNTDSDTKTLESTNNTLEPQATYNSLNSTTVRKSDNIESINVINEENTSSEKVLDPIASLRSASDEINESESKEDNLLLKTEIDTKPEQGKQYEVYEVAAEKPPFTLSSNMNTNEQPRYVPVYEYAPEKAYFRPYDRFGSNNEDIEQEYVQNYDNIIQKRSRFSSYNKHDKRQFKIQHNIYPNNHGNSKMYGFMKPVSFGNAIKYYNPYDYFDIDYNNRYNGRSYLRNGKYKSFPGSDEVDHPYNAIHKSNSLKDHVRTIRKLLYLQKVFGYVPEIYKENRKFDHETAIQIKKRKEKFLKKHPIDDIGIDYYYDRASSKEDEKAIQGNMKLPKKLPTKEAIRNFNAGPNTDNQKSTTDLDGFEKFNELNDIIEDDSKFSSFFDTLLNVLDDNIRFNSEALEHYDWLKTSVDIQSAITKLLDLAEGLKHGEDIHPKDLELLKYSMYLFKSSKRTLQDSLPKSIGKNGHRRKKKMSILPKSNRNRNRIKQPLKLWKDFATYLRNNFKYDTEQKLTLLNDFEDFLQNVLFNVKEFHEAIKHVAIVTRFNDQNWFNDIKQIYLKKATKKQLGQVILHLSLVNLLDRVEEDAVNGAESNFRQFVENNQEAVTATKKKFAFVLRVLKEINRLNV